MLSTYIKKPAISLLLLAILTSGCFLPGRDDPPEPSEEPGGLEAVTEIELDLTNDWYVATTGDDANSCATPEEPCLTLSGAVRKALPLDRIHLAAGTYLGRDGMGERLPGLYRSVTIIGAGSGSTILDVNGVHGGLAMLGDSVVHIEGLTIQNTDRGGAASGCLSPRANSQLTAEDVVLRNCWRSGLTHSSSGVVELTNVIISDARDENTDPDFTVNGSGIVNNGEMIIIGGEVRNSERDGIQNGGSLTVTGSTIRDNQSYGVWNDSASASSFTSVTISNNTLSGRGTGMFINSGMVTISDSNVIGNGSTAIFLRGTSSLFMDTSTISDHTVRAIQITRESVVELDDVTITNNGLSSEWGPIIWNEGTFTMLDSRIISNFQQAVYNIEFASATITESEISGNRSEFGTVVNRDETSEMFISRSLIANNTVTDSFSGAVSNEGIMEMENTTVSNNSRAGIRIDGDTRLSYVTVAENRGVGLMQGGPGPFTVENTLIAKNTGGDCTTSFAFYSGSLRGNNIDTDGTCGFTETYSPTDIRLGILADNGGSTFTHELLNDPDSPAIDTATGACPPTDQREFGRAGLCDVGAYETSAVALSAPDPGFIIGTPTPGGPSTVTIITTTPCYQGPGPQYGLVNNLASGISTQLVGAGFTGNGNQDWVVASHPTAANTNCWLDTDDVTPSIPFSEMRLITVPGLPTPTPRPTSDRPAPDDTPVPCYYNANNLLICP